MPRRSLFNLMKNRGGKKFELENLLREFNVKGDFIFNDERYNMSEDIRDNIRIQLLNILKEQKNRIRRKGSLKRYVQYLNYGAKSNMDVNFNNNNTYLQFYLDPAFNSEELQNIKNMYYKNFIEDVFLLPEEIFDIKVAKLRNHELIYWTGQFRQDEFLTYEERNVDVITSLKAKYKRHFNIKKKVRNRLKTLNNQENQIRSNYFPNENESKYFVGDPNLNNSCDLSKIPIKQLILIPNNNIKQYVFGKVNTVSQNGYLHSCNKKFIANPMLSQSQLDSKTFSYSIYLNRIYTLGALYSEDLIPIRILLDKTENGYSYIPIQYWTKDKSISYFNERIDLDNFVGCFFLYISDKLNIYLLFKIKKEKFNRFNANFYHYIIYDIYGNKIPIGKLFKTNITTFDELWLFAYHKLNFYEYLPVRKPGKLKMYFTTRHNLEEETNNITLNNNNLIPTENINKKNIKKLLLTGKLKNITKDFRYEMYKKTNNFIPLYEDANYDKIKRKIQNLLKGRKNIISNGNINMLRKINNEINELKKGRKIIINQQIDSFKNEKRLQYQK